MVWLSVAVVIVTVRRIMIDSMESIFDHLATAFVLLDQRAIQHPAEEQFGAILVSLLGHPALAEPECIEHLGAIHL